MEISTPNEIALKKTADFDKYYKKMDSGFTFYSYLSETKAVIVGKIQQIEDQICPV